MPERTFRVLLVEDNAGDVYLFKLALQEAGAKVDLTVIADGDLALSFVAGEGRYAGRSIPDLAVLDLNLPKRDGREVLEAIRGNAELARLPVVVTSSSASPEDRLRTERLGVERYVRKPSALDGFLELGVELNELLQRIG